LKTVDRGNRIPQNQSKNPASIPFPAGDRMETNRFPVFRPARRRVVGMKKFPEKENLFRTGKLFVDEFIASRLNHLLPHCLHLNNNVSSSLCQWADFLLRDAYDLIEKMPMASLNPRDRIPSIEWKGPIFRKKIRPAR
jgi:hypothetical protein